MARGGRTRRDQFTNVKPTFQERIGSLDNPNLQTFLTHLRWADDGSEAAIAGQRLYDDVLAQSGLNEAKTKEDVLRAFGRMAAMGVCPGAWLEPMFIDGKVCLYAKYYLEEEMVEPVIDGLDLAIPDQPSLLQMMQDAPSLQSHLVPLAGRSGTRAVPDDCLPLRYIVEGMASIPRMSISSTITTRRRTCRMSASITRLKEISVITTKLSLWHCR